MGSRRTENQLRKIRTLACLAELTGYEEQAKKRGITPEELEALLRKRQELEKKK